jgi:hypothetical protein
MNVVCYTSRCGGKQVFNGSGPSLSLANEMKQIELSQSPVEPEDPLCFPLPENIPVKSVIHAR